VQRLEKRGGTVVCGQRVEQVVVRHGGAVGVRTAAGEVAARRAVLADVDAPSLYLRLLPTEVVPRRVVEAIRRFQWDWATVKVDWTLDGAVPWSNEEAQHAPVVHVTDSMDMLSIQTNELARRLIPARPFLVFGQYSMIDSTRSPAGKETAWAYTHVPAAARGDASGQLSGEWHPGELEQFVERMELEIEQLAPGFRKLIRGRHVLAPDDLQARNENLVRGALNGGTAQIHQQLVFRPMPGLGRPETPVKRLYLASASAHPGGGVHGGAGAIAARAAVTLDRSRRTALAAGAAALAAGMVRTRRSA
jgi:phytoene dehydrogenase-like protein